MSWQENCLFYFLRVYMFWFLDLLVKWPVFFWLLMMSIKLFLRLGNCFAIFHVIALKGELHYSSFYTKTEDQALELY